MQASKNIFNLTNHQINTLIEGTVQYSVDKALEKKQTRLCSYLSLTIGGSHTQVCTFASAQQTSPPCWVCPNLVRG